MPWQVVNAPPISAREEAEVVSNLKRKEKPRFYADENFPEEAIALLRRMGANVVTAHEKGFDGHPDENHMAFAKRTGRVLLTCDRDYLDERKFPLMSCAAVTVFDFGGRSPSQMVRAFDALSGVFAAPAFYDKWMKIDARQDCWTETAHFQNGEQSKARFRVHNGRIEEWKGEEEG